MLTRIGFWYSLALLGASSVVQLATFVPTISIGMAQVYPIHLLLMPLALILFACLARTGWRRRSSRATSGIFSRLKASHSDWHEMHRNMTKSIPLWLRTGILVAFCYAGFTMYSVYVLMDGGGPVEQNGEFFLSNHGQVIRQIDALEYQRCLAYEARIFSAGWIVMSLFMVTYFAYVDDWLRKGAGASQSVSNHSPSSHD